MQLYKLDALPFLVVLAGREGTMETEMEQKLTVPRAPNTF